MNGQENLEVREGGREGGVGDDAMCVFVDDQENLEVRGGGEEGGGKRVKWNDDVSPL